MSDDNCENAISDDEIQAVLSTEEYLNYLDKIFNAPSETHQRSTETHPALLILEDNEYVENQLKFLCHICLDEINPGDGITLKSCLHEYCKVCLSKRIELSEEPEVPCPFVAECGTHCEGFIQDRELQSLITPEVYQAHLAKSYEYAEATTKNSFHCKTPDCTGWVEVDEGAISFNCPICLKTSCVKCKANHEGKSCNDYYYEINSDARKQRDDGLTEAQVQSMVRSNQAMSCPGCGIIIQKTVGCNHMTCSRCKREFQWLGQQ